MRNFKLFTFHFSLLTLLLLSATACSKDDETYSDKDDDTALIKVGMAAPSFELKAMDGSVVTSESLKGKVYILNFFDTTCPDCRNEFPVLQQIYDEYGETVPLFNVPRSQAVEDADAYCKEHGLTLPIYSDGAQRLYYQFATRTIPRTYVINADGIVIASFNDKPIADYASLNRILQANR